MANRPETPEQSTGDYPTLGAPAPSTPRPPRLRIEVGAATHAGRVRENNEDSYLVARLVRTVAVEGSSLPGLGKANPIGRPVHVLILADGMGGVVGGERASAMAVESLVGSALDDFRSSNPTCPHDDETIAGELRCALERADRALIRASNADARLYGMGTTITMAFIVSGTAYLAHAGDSRGYLYRGGVLAQVTHDHTLVQMMVKGGLIRPEEARTHQRRNVVTNVLGGPAEGVLAEIHKRELADGDVLLLCSDGLSEPVEDAEIAAILAREADPKAAADALVAAALAGGGPDNVTVIVARARAEGGG